MLDILRDHWLLLLIGQYPHGPLGGMAATVLIAVASMILTMPAAVALALASRSGFAPVRWAARAFVQTMRAMPLLMLLFWAYFLIPSLTGQRVSGLVILIVALALYKASYLCEILRAGIDALPDGQFAAARALGLGQVDTMFRIILPQALRNTLPSLVTQFVGIVKDSSVGYIIGVSELTFAANQLNTTLLTRPFEVFMILALLYFLLNSLITGIGGRLEARLARRDQALPATPALTPALVRSP